MKIDLDDHVLLIMSNKLKEQQFSLIQRNVLRHLRGEIVPVWL